ncbi:3-oxoacyl-[acyl-carrier-protein] synthase [Xylographa soralifera]|nr:3-oxoacyl-[acyl-carrier-protein] synthase [Xylographa soralifera]
MARRTLASKYRASDATRSLKRQILALAEDEKEICYQVDPVEEKLEETEQSSKLIKLDPLATAIASVATPATGVVVSMTLATDSPVTATDIVRALVAQKLRKPLQDVPLGKTIKELSGGKSTLQNELVGNLENEFGSLPENPEENSLEQLGDLLQTYFHGELGKQSSAHVGKMISTKMPGRFNAAAVKKHLETRWGLGPQRQQGVMLIATTMQPGSRFEHEEEAKAFLDDMAREYSLHVGIDLAAQMAGVNAEHSATNVMVDSAALEVVEKKRTQLSLRQFHALAQHLEMDLRAGDRALSILQTKQNDLQAKLDVWDAEHGEYYGIALAPRFSSRRMRVYDSSWNWVRQDILSLHYKLVSTKTEVSGKMLAARKDRIFGKATRSLIEFLQHLVEASALQKGRGYSIAGDFELQLLRGCHGAIDSLPVFKSSLVSTAPETTIDGQGLVKYLEIPRKEISTINDYVCEMSDSVQAFERYRWFQESKQTLRKKDIDGRQYTSRSIAVLHLEIPNGNDMLSRSSTIPTPPAESSDEDSHSSNITPPSFKPECLPYLHLKHNNGAQWDYSPRNTSMYIRALDHAARSGISFQNKTALLTGTGAGSIGAMVVQGLLAGGAKVITTTSSLSQEVAEYYQAIYAQHGSRDSRLIVFPFNQGSKQDVEGLIDHIYSVDQGQGWDLDYIVPFAAISENGSEIDTIESKSEMAHRIMLTNLLRLLGSVKRHKLLKGYRTRPAQVLLPLSPNHGTFGRDGLYSESKMGLETLFNKWHSESWSEYLTVCGISIGWTRGTGLMNSNNIIAEGIEKLGTRTFSQEEMAFNILCLMTPEIRRLCEREPVYADLNGSVNSIPNLQAVTRQLRDDVSYTSDILTALTRELTREAAVVNGNLGASQRIFNLKPRANMVFEFPQLPDFKTSIAPLGEKLREMVDLERVVVVTGFAELGSWGNSRTRWEMEAHGKFSTQGCIEMAWIMGLIKFHNGSIKGRREPYIGWVDSKTGSPIDDEDVKSTYEKYILEHTGIRLIEPDLLVSSDDRMLQEVVVQEDLDPFETSMETALDFKRQQGDKAEVYPIPGSAEYLVQFKAGATIMVPKAPFNYEQFVAAQIPTGWDARRYGIPDDIVSQVDRVTLYALVATAEALLSAGILDPYELYQYVHVSEVGNCLGSGFGGADSLRAIYRDRTFDKSVQHDILQETFVNTIGAWVQMLLLSSSGPIKTPVGACATAIESLDLGYETILNGHAKVCFVGAADTYGREAAIEFANMKATSNVIDEFDRGRGPKEMSRPATSSRNGFLESEGSGVQIITTAKLALEMGLPIYGIVALTTTASDKTGRSVPSPGQGILTVAREERSKYPSPLLDIDYRRKQLDIQLNDIKRWQKTAMTQLQLDTKVSLDYLQDRTRHIERKGEQQRRNAFDAWGNTFWKHDLSIAPLRGALATWGLSIDDLDVVSLHGTSTVANDINEADVISKELKHLGRKQGNTIFGVCQKYLTGHPKGPAGAWMFNGGLQILNSGLVPGNRNADNIDKKLEEFDLIFYPSHSIQTDGVKALLTSSFGFGQKSAQAVSVHSKYLFATLDEASYNQYKEKAQAREKRAYRHMHRALRTNTIFRAKNKPPYDEEEESRTLLSPNARASACKDTSPQSYTVKPMVPAAVQDPSEGKIRNQNIAQQPIVPPVPAGTRIGVDIEDVDAIDISSDTFVDRNFTRREQLYCREAPSPQHSFIGRWSAKEAVFKSLNIAGKGAGASMIDIEITHNARGGPVVTLHGDVDAAAREAKVTSVGVSISHSEKQVIAIATASFEAA